MRKFISHHSNLLHNETPETTPEQIEEYNKSFERAVDELMRNGSHGN